MLIVHFIIAVCVLSSIAAENGPLNFTAMSAKYGYRAEQHSVTTEDGYILTVFRLPGKKPPVLLVHGLMDTADAFILRGKKSLAIALANKGYDVWLANTRGNKYSRRHTKLNPDLDDSFWDYSFHEHGYYDVPAITDYVLNATGEKTLKSVGHSEGTTDHFVLGSTRPEYNKKFAIFIALAPSAFLKHFVPPMSLLTELGPVIDEVLRPFKIEALFNDKPDEKSIVQRICNQKTASVCGDFLLRLGGYDPKRIEPEFFVEIFRHFPSSGSRKGLLHYSQVALRKRFSFYDYGYTENMKRYGAGVPPDYNLKQNTMRTALFVGKNDLINCVRDVEYLRAVLPNIVQYHLLKPKLWNHFDFIWANDMDKTLFPHVISLLEKY